MICSVCSHQMRYSKYDHPDYPLFCSLKCLIDCITFPVSDSEYTSRVVEVPFPNRFRKTQKNEYRSQYEVKFAWMLKKAGIRFVYEPCAIRLQNGDRWVPDFKILTSNKLIEVKGLWRSGSKQKMRSIADEIGTDIVIVVPDSLCRLLRKGGYEYNPRFF